MKIDITGSKLPVTLREPHKKYGVAYPAKIGLTLLQHADGTFELVTCSRDVLQNAEEVERYKTIAAQN
jgi:hypothetical protein